MSTNNSKQPVSPAAGLLSNTTCQIEEELSISFSITFMTVGILSNSLAIAILMKAYQRFRQKYKSSFLLLASALVITDFFGHLINGAIAVFVYASDKDWIHFDKSNVLCTLGISFFCNAITGISLLRVKFKSQQHRQGRSHHFEMVIQLLGIMCVSCVCWSPFLELKFRNVAQFFMSDLFGYSCIAADLRGDLSETVLAGFLCEEGVVPGLECGSSNDDVWRKDCMT
eukprot:bmy_19259T0